MASFAFDEQVAGEARAVAAALSSVEVPILDRDRPVLFSGIGTSLHACRVAAYWTAELSGGRFRPAALEAHHLSLHGHFRPGDQLVVVSHRGTKRFPNELLARARAVGATTVNVTGWGNGSPGGDFVLRTGPDERAGTHSVSYLTALAVLGKLVTKLIGSEADSFASALAAVPDAIERTLEEPVPSEAAQRLDRREPILVTGFGIDEITAEEAALKLKEGTYIWAEGMSQEFSLHGTPAVFEPRSGAILIMPGRDDGGRVAEVHSMLLELGVDVLTCGSEPADLHFAEVDYLLRPLVGIVPFHRLVGELARLHGSNPDTIRAEEAPWSSAVPKVKL
ncbi:MAG: SIS domain-containing protein [Candidatus Dormibacteria bacterium]